MEGRAGSFSAVPNAVLRNPGSRSCRPRPPAIAGDSLETPRSRSRGPGGGQPPTHPLRAAGALHLWALPVGSTLTVPSASRIPPAGRDPGCPVFSDKGEKNHSSLISSEFIICRYLGKVFKAVGLCFFLKNSAGRGRLRRGSPGAPPGQRRVFGKFRGKRWGRGLQAGSSESRSLAGQLCTSQLQSCVCLQRLTHLFIFLALLSK